MADVFPFQDALITGGAGFIGSHLAECLLSHGIRVTILDNLSSGFKSNIPLGAEFVEGDVRDQEAVKSAARGKDIFFHFAEYIPNIPGHIIKFSNTNPRDDLDVCVGGTINVLEEARANDSDFVLASTAAVYGSTDGLALEDTVPKPISPYGASKLCAETYTMLYRRTYNVPVTILRFFNVFGPRQRKYLMYDYLAKTRRNPAKVELLGTGKEVRDYIFVNDVIERIVALASIKKNSPADPIFNIGTGKGRSTDEVVSSLSAELSVWPEISTSGSLWVGNSNRLVADVRKTASYVDCKITPFELSLKQLVSWFNDEEGSVISTAAKQN